jgi:hypothetical protein
MELASTPPVLTDLQEDTINAEMDQRDDDLRDWNLKTPFDSTGRDQTPKWLESPCVPKRGDNRSPSRVLDHELVCRVVCVLSCGPATSVGTCLHSRLIVR